MEGNAPARRSSYVTLQITANAFYRLPPRVRRLLKSYGRELPPVWRGGPCRIELPAYRVPELDQALAEDLVGAVLCPACRLPLLPGELEQRHFLAGHCHDCAATATATKTDPEILR